MKGQVWQEYVLVFAGILLVTIGVLAHIYQPSIHSIICTTAYMRAQSEIARQEFSALADYTIHKFKCDFDRNPSEINIICRCAEPGEVENVVREELNNFEITPQIAIEQVT